MTSTEKLAELRRLIDEEKASISWTRLRDVVIRSYPEIGGSFQRVTRIAQLYAELRIEQLDIDWPGPDAIIEPQVIEQVNKGIKSLIDAIASGKSAMPES